MMLGLGQAGPAHDLFETRSGSDPGGVGGDRFPGIVMVELRLYGRLRAFAGISEVAVDPIARVPIQGSATVGELLGKVGIDIEREVSNIFVNGRHIGRASEAVVSGGDRVGVFPRDMGLLYC